MTIHITFENGSNPYILSGHPEAIARELAIEYSCKVGESVQSWQGVSELYVFFETLGKRFGLLREFHENAIA